MKRGVTLLEVLIAILVVTVALLAAVALFAVVNSQTRKGQIAGVTAAGGDAAVARVTVEGMISPAAG